MPTNQHRAATVVTLGLILCVGCASPYHSDQGALFGGLLGAGTGAAVGSAVGKAGAGAAIGAGVGALSGLAVGSEMDKMEAQNRAMIEQKLGRQISATPVQVEDVINMTRAGVDQDLIANHVRAHGMARPLQPNDLIVLQQQGVSKPVIAAMQAPPPVPQPAVYQAVPAPAPGPVIIEEYPGYWGPHYYYRPHYYRPPPPGVTWGISVRG